MADGQNEEKENKFEIADGVLTKYYGPDENVTIPDGVTVIGGGAFTYRDIKSVVIPEEVTAIVGDAFCECNSLVSVKLPGSVEKIGEKDAVFSSFQGCEALESVELNEGLRIIEHQCFYACRSLYIRRAPQNDYENRNICVQGVRYPGGCDS